MGNRRQDRRVKKLFKKRVLLSPPPPPHLALTSRDMATDQAEIALFLSHRRFQWVIREIKKKIYRKPQNAIRQSQKSGIVKS